MKIKDNSTVERYLAEIFFLYKDQYGNLVHHETNIPAHHIYLESFMKDLGFGKAEIAEFIKEME